MPRHPRTLLTPILFAALLASAAPVARADALHLRWGACERDGGVMNRSFACNTNLGGDLLTASFGLTAPVPQVQRLSFTIVLATATYTLPAWWDVTSSAGCRAGALRADATNAPSAVACDDWAAGQAVAFVTSVAAVPYYGAVSLRVTGDVAASAPVDLPAGPEWFAFHWGWSHARTTGTPACGGCDVPACIALHRIDLYDGSGSLTPVRTVTVFDSPPAAAIATWQGGAGVVRTNQAGFTDCPAATPTHHSAWSALKSLYR